MRAAGADSTEALERAERASDEIRSLDLDLNRHDEELETLGGTLALSAEAGDADLDAVTLRLSDVDVEFEQLRANASMIDRRIGSAEAGLGISKTPRPKPRRRPPTPKQRWPACGSSPSGTFARARRASSWRARCTSGRRTRAPS